MSYVILFLLLALIIIIDIKHKYVYEGMSLLGALLALHYQYFQGNVLDALIGIDAGIMVVFAMNNLMGHKIGGGDAKTLAMVGAFLGYLPVLFITFIAHTLCDIYRKVKRNYTTLPYTPFIGVATLMVVIFLIGMRMYGS